MRRRLSHHIVPCVLIVASLLWATFCALHFCDLQSGSQTALGGFNDQVAPTVSRSRAVARRVTWKVQRAVEKAIPDWDMVGIWKLAICTAAAALFLGRPRGA